MTNEERNKLEEILNNFHYYSNPENYSVHDAYCEGYIAAYNECAKALDEFMNGINKFDLRINDK